MYPRIHLVVTVACAHLLALWALQSAVPHQKDPATVPMGEMSMTVLAQVIDASEPRPVEPPLARLPAPGLPGPLEQQQRPAAAATPAPLSVSVPAPAPAPAPAPTKATVQPPVLAPGLDVTPDPAPATHAAASAGRQESVERPAPAPFPGTGTGTATASAPTRVELPSSNAAYLNNPAPPYPALSRRLGEEGRVIVRAFIDVDGKAGRAEVRQSSGFERLDQTALETVQGWRFRPGKRNGTPTAMWFDIPLAFELR